MFTTRWRLFRLLGFPINVDASWLIILALLTWSLQQEFARSRYLPLTLENRLLTTWLLGLGTALAFFACIVLHELGHAVVARASGIPLHGITLFLFGGVAEMRGEPASARDEFWMAVAGPLVSAFLAIGFGLLSRVGGEAVWWEVARAVFDRLAWINLLVLAFNLIPAFPLDGGRVLRSALWGATHNLRRATYWASLLGQGFAGLLIAGGVLLFIRGDLNGIWMGLIGLFLNNAARSSYQQVLIRQTLAGEPVGRFMNPHPVVVPPTLNLREWVEDYVYHHHRKAFPVVQDGRLQGVITTRALAEYPRESWDQHTVGEVMRHDVTALSIGPGADALQALGKMQATGSSRLLVVEGDRLLGIISLKDLLRFLHLKLELEGEGGEEARPPGPRQQDSRSETGAPS
jgi:Zn-dependent protease/CBS domain-containing protein